VNSIGPKVSLVQVGSLEPTGFQYGTQNQATGVIFPRNSGQEVKHLVMTLFERCEYVYDPEVLYRGIQT
jgi:hypothetical protein